MKKLFSFVLALSMALALTACGGSADTDSTTTDDTAETTAEPVELHVFAAASMQESLDQVIKPTRPWLRKSPSWRLMTPPAP